MNRLSALMILIYAACVSLVAQVNRDSVLQYFPLTVGNVWKYRVTGSSEKTVTVRLDRIQPEGLFTSRYYIFRKDPFDTIWADSVSRIYIDTVSMTVMSSQSPRWLNENLTVKAGETFGDSWRCDSIRTESVMGIQTVVKYMTQNLPTGISHYKTAWKFGTIGGTVGSQLFGFDPSGTYELLFAKINGKAYGIFMDADEADSLRQFYPYAVGNKWYYQSTFKPGSFRAPTVKYISAEVVSDTLINAKRYSVVRYVDSGTNSTSYRYFRCDGVEGNVYSLNAYNADVLYDSLSVSACKGSLNISSSTSDPIFGKTFPLRTISSGAGVDSYNYRKNAWGLGMIAEGYEHAFGATLDNILLYARIDGKEYGTIPTAANREGSTTPVRFGLLPNYPNPFNPSTTIGFTIAERSFVSLKIYDALGREAATLHSGTLSAGSYERQWNAAGFQSGVYFCTLRAGTLTQSRRIVLLK